MPQLVLRFPSVILLCLDGPCHSPHGKCGFGTTMGQGGFRIGAGGEAMSPARVDSGVPGAQGLGLEEGTRPQRPVHPLLLCTI